MYGLGGYVNAVLYIAVIWEATAHCKYLKKDSALCSKLQELGWVCGGGGGAEPLRVSAP
jgi:hypothetical protein